MGSPSLDALEAATSFPGSKKLCLQWRLARRDDLLPFYEDVGLGSLGALADDTALLQQNASGDFVILRAGKAVAEQFDIDAAGTVDALAANYRDPFRIGLAAAITAREPSLALARTVSEGLVVTFEILSLPLLNRWGGELVLSYIKQRPKSHDLVEAIYRSTSNGLMALAAMPVTTYGLDFQIVSLNAGAAAILGKPEAEIRWQALTTLIPQADTDVLFPRLAEALASQLSSEFEFGYVGTRGVSLHLRISVAPIGNLLGVTINDISAIKLREEAVKSLFESNPMPLLLYDRQTLGIVRVNDALVSSYGYGRERWQSLTLPDLHPTEEREAVGTLMGGPARDQDAQRLWHHVTAEGSVRDVHVYSRDLDFQGRSSVLLSIVDVTEQRKAQASVVFMAHHDHLTSLANRVLFRTCLEDGLKSAQRGESLAVHMIDLDRFKAVNDTMGHSVGDEALRAVADRIRSVVSGKEIVARLGGDEFAVIQFNPANESDIPDLARRLIERISADYVIEGHTIRLGASIGISVAPGNGMNSDAILHNADVALYRAKASGKGVYRLYEAGMSMRHDEQQGLEGDLGLALRAGQMSVHYQPILDVESESIVGCEALMRWTHPELGTIPPSTFIPLAERSTLICDLGDWILHEACREAARWPDPVSVAVNLSAMQFAGGRLIGSVATALRDSRLAPRRLELEITESMLLQRSPEHRDTLEQLRTMGVAISLDDFGTGYASFDYLRSFPVDKIKIDRSFVRDIADQPECAAIIRAVAGLGASLGIATVAEGVETRDQFRLIREEGCSQVQGYLFGKPVLASEIRAILDRRLSGTSALAADLAA